MTSIVLYCIQLVNLKSDSIGGTILDYMNHYICQDIIYVRIYLRRSEKSVIKIKNAALGCGS